MCLESTVGIVGGAIGLGMASLADNKDVTLSNFGFTFAVAGTLAFGPAIKDWVIAWSPWGLRREKDHLNLIVRWKG